MVSSKIVSNTVFLYYENNYFLQKFLASVLILCLTMHSAVSIFPIFWSASISVPPVRVVPITVPFPLIRFPVIQKTIIPYTYAVPVVQPVEEHHVIHHHEHHNEDHHN